MNEALIYKALGDPVRLDMVKRLAEGSQLTIGALSENLSMTRQGARKQLQILVEAEVVQLVPHGRETQVVLNFVALKTARDFIRQLEAQWDQRLAALKSFVEADTEE